MPIQLLDQHTAELIAAGEVVERPASVVKELVENAIDAGATNIQVEIEGGGIRLIRIQDNGTGIDADEIPLAFLRHATSKVRTKEDLDGITTLGFRGEALASIASVSRVELLTKTEASEFASLYRIEGGTESGLEPAARPIGTTFSVHSLFYNTPARMKFLKKDTSEGTFVTETVTRLALSHPEISFRYLRDGKQVFFTPGDGKLESTAYAVLGGEFAKGLLKVDCQERQYRVYGLVTSPKATRASRSMQFFFINNRFVKNRTMMAALEQAYRGMAMQGKFPGCVLFLEMPYENVDVNVHPAKTEVRFAKESDVFDIVYKGVKGALIGDMGNHPSLSFGGTAAEPKQAQYNPLVAPVSSNGAVPPPLQTQVFMGTVQPGQPAQEKPSMGAVKSYNTMVETLASEPSHVPYSSSKPINSVPVYEGSLTIEPEQGEEEPRQQEAVIQVEDRITILQPQQAVPEPQQQTLTEEQIMFAKTEEATLRLVGELFHTYIVAESGDTLCMIDKHAAHERILYEKLVQEANQADAQQLLAPVTVTLSAAEKNALLQNTDALQAAGIEVEDFGGNGVLVRSVPANIEVGNISDLVIEVADRLTVNAKDTASEKTEWVLHSVACRSAVKAGDKTPPEQLLKLAQDILAGVIPPFCPHGRPVVLEITRKELEKQFGRLG